MTAPHQATITLSPGGRNWKPAPRPAKAAEQPAPMLRLPAGSSRVKRVQEARDDVILAALARAARIRRQFYNAHPDLGFPVSPRALWSELTGSIDGFSPQVTAALTERLDALVARGLAVHETLESAGKPRPVYWPAKEAQP